MINKDMTILQILQLYPETSTKFWRVSVWKCSECMAAGEESLEKECQRHNVNLSDLQEIT